MRTNACMICSPDAHCSAAVCQHPFLWRGFFWFIAEIKIKVTFQLIGLAFKHISAKIQRANSLIFVSMSQLSHCKRMKLKTHYELFCLRGSTLSCGIQKWIRPNKTNISKPLLSVKYKVFKTKVSHLVTNKPIRVREILISMNSSWKLRRLLLTSRVIWEPLGLRYIKRVYYCDVTHSAVIGNQLRGFLSTSIGLSLYSIALRSVVFWKGMYSNSTMLHHCSCVPKKKKYKFFKFVDCKLCRFSWSSETSRFLFGFFWNRRWLALASNYHLRVQFHKKVILNN